MSNRSCRKCKCKSIVNENKIREYQKKNSSQKNKPLELPSLIQRERIQIQQNNNNNNKKIKSNLILLQQKQHNHNYLQQNVHIIWLFVTKNTIIPEQFKKIIKNVYLSTTTNEKQIENIIQNSKYLGFQKHLQKINNKNKKLKNNQTIQYILPIINNPQHIRQLMNISKIKNKFNQQQFVFKVLTDCQSFESVTNIVADLRKQNQKINQIHVYWKQNSEYQKITSKYQQIKNIIKKYLLTDCQIKTIIKSFCRDTTDIQRQIVSQSPLLLKLSVNPFTKQILIKKKVKFIIIDNQFDKSEYTLLRQTIQLSKILPKQYLIKYKQKTVNIARQKYKQYQTDIQSYETLLLPEVNKIDFYKQILYTYTKSSFYHQLLNNSLRKSTNYNDLQHCIAPISQMYRSISQMYKKYIIKNNYKIQKDIILYKGCKITENEYKKLKKGQFIQFYGFLSTSLLKIIAEKFVKDNDKFRVILQIKISKRIFTQEQLQNFIGFVDFYNFKQQILLKSSYPDQKQVILNALSVLKIINITELNKQSLDKDEIHYIKTQLFDLQNYSKNASQKKILSLNDLQNIPIISHKYNIGICKQKINDIGDMFMYTNNFQQAQKFYEQKANYEKINNNSITSAEYLLKQVDACRFLGKVDKADELLKQAQKIYINSDNLSSIERKLKIRVIHNYYVQIQKQTLNFPQLQYRYLHNLQKLSKDDPDNVLQIAKIMYELANVKLKKEKYNKQKKIFIDAKKKFKSHKANSKKSESFSLIKSLLTKSSKNKTKNTENKQNIVQNLQQNFKQFKKLQIKINMSLLEANQKSLFISQNYKQQYKNCISQTLHQVTNLYYQNMDPIQKAQIDAMKARVYNFQNKIKAEATFKTLINNLQQNIDKNHKNIVFYCQQLAQTQNKILNEVRNEPNDQNKYYDISKIEKYYNACKNNLLKARKILQNCRNPGHEQNIRQIDNQISKIDIQNQKFKQGQLRIQNIKQQYLKSNNKVRFNHYNLSKTQFLNATLNFERGYNKKAFQYLQLSEKYLNFAMVGRHNARNDHNKTKQYNVFLYNSQLYLKIKFLLSKIYHRQLKNDMALKEINNLIAIMKKIINFIRHIIQCHNSYK